jgi:hypothetical protein
MAEEVALWIKLKRGSVYPPAFSADTLSRTSTSSAAALTNSMVEISDIGALFNDEEADDEIAVGQEEDENSENSLFTRSKKKKVDSSSIRQMM